MMLSQTIKLQAMTDYLIAFQKKNCLRAKERATSCSSYSVCHNPLELSLQTLTTSTHLHKRKFSLRAKSIFGCIQKTCIKSTNIQIRPLFSSMSSHAWVISLFAGRNINGVVLIVTNFTSKCQIQRECQIHSQIGIISTLHSLYEC